MLVDTILGLPSNQLSILIIDLMKIRNFIMTNSRIWMRIGFAHSVGCHVKDLFNYFNISTKTKDFILRLLDEGGYSFNEIEKIIDSVIENHKNKADIEFVFCRTAFEVKKTDKANLLSALEDIFSAKVHVDYKVDPSISGGCSIEFREYSVDISYKKCFAKKVKEYIKEGISIGGNEE